MQATIEEQHVSNEELKSVNEKLAEMQNDMKNLLDNINIGTIFPDVDLLIRRFTREAAKIYRLADTRTVLETLVSCERELANRQ